MVQAKGLVERGQREVASERRRKRRDQDTVEPSGGRAGDGAGRIASEAVRHQPLARERRSGGLATPPPDATGDGRRVSHASRRPAGRSTTGAWPGTCQPSSHSTSGNPVPPYATSSEPQRIVQPSRAGGASKGSGAG